VKSIIILSDVHLEYGLKTDKSYEVVKNFIKEYKTEKVVLGGDFLDFSYLGAYNKDAPMLMENKRLYKDIDIAKREIDFFRKYSKKDVLYLEGNHEERLRRQVSRTPMIADNILTLKKLLNVPFVLLEDQPVEIVDNLFCMHGHRYSMHLAAATVKDYMENVIVGHAHRLQTWATRTMKHSKVCWSSGCLCSKTPKYLKGRHSIWNNGFVLVEYDNKGFTVNNILIEDNSFIWNGKRWK
jgi:metallophosphoesterase superfamily enzyme